MNPGTGAAVDTISGSMVGDLVTGYANASDTPASGDYGHDVGGELDVVAYSTNLSQYTVAYSLPSGTVAWSETPGNPLSSLPNIGVDPETHAAFAYTTGSNSGAVTLVRFDPATGRILWKHAGPVYCGATNGHVYVEANSELVELDETTGSQISYNTDIQSCPTVEDGVLDEAVKTDAGDGGPFFEHTDLAG